MKARDLFDSLKAAIREAEAKKQFDIPLAFAEANGFLKKEINYPGLAFECTYFGEDGAIRLVYRSWDPSGPFQSLPDINRYFLTLFESSDHYSLDYPD